VGAVSSAPARGLCRLGRAACAGRWTGRRIMHSGSGESIRRTSSSRAAPLTAGSSGAIPRARR